MTEKKGNISLSQPQRKVLRSDKDRNLYHSGQGGGKSHMMGLLSYFFGRFCTTSIGQVAANTYEQLSTSTLVRIFEVWKGLGWTEYDAKKNPDGFFVIDKQPPADFVPHPYTFKTNSNKIFLRNGHVIFTNSLDNYKALDGREISYCLLDETKDTKEDAVKKVIIGRLRAGGVFRKLSGAKGVPIGFVGEGHDSQGEQANPLFVFTSPAKEQWLTEFFKLDTYREEILSCIFSQTDYFYKKEGNRCVVIASTYHNAANLPPNYISNMVGDLSQDVIELNIYGSPFGKTGAEYYSEFKSTTHKKRVEFTPGIPIKITWDFNVNPYMSMQIWQYVEVQGRLKLRCLKEYALKAPRNSIEDVCRDFRRDFGDKCWAGLFYYGDSSGRARTVIKSSRDYYIVIERELAGLLHPGSRKLLKSNPRHRGVGRGTLGRRDHMNKIFSGGYGVDVEIDPSCEYTLADFEFCKEDANGAKEKKVVEINGVRCQKYGHMSDAADGLLCYDFGDYRKE